MSFHEGIMFVISSVTIGVLLFAGLTLLVGAAL